MRRGLKTFCWMAAFAVLTPCAFGQYPYPAAPPGYGPMPYPVPGYGPAPYAPPVYGPAPMYGQPMMPMPYVAPPPPWQPPRPTVFVYGPLTDPDAPVAKPAVKPAPIKPAPVKPAQPTASATAKSGELQPFPTVAKNGAAPAKGTVAGKGDPSMKASTGVTQVQATVPAPAPAQPLAVRNAPCGMGDSCGVYGCGACCPDAGCCDPIALPRPPLYGHGHWVGEVGAYFLVPYPTSRAAYSTTGGGAASATNTDFPQTVDFGARVSLGYLFHNGWGVRANYSYLEGNSNQTTATNDPTVTIAAPMPAPFQITSPGFALQNGLGVDQFAFQQRLNINVADLEVLKEFQWMDTTFLASVGGRYARVQQSYSATRNNTGGANGLVTVNIDRSDLESASNFDGWGPTASFEVMHLLGKSNFSVYANVRGSALWGVNRFSQNLAQQQASVDNTGVPTFVNTDVGSYEQSHREVTMLEAEAGLQYGCRFGRCYVFGRVGALYQRWFDVGNPTSANGDLAFFGGTARIGITY